MSWKEVSMAAQAELLQSIPAKWRLDTDAYKDLTDVSRVPRECGLLTEKQLQITELNVTDLADRIASRRLKAVEVVEAFAGRAVIAHQLVNCLTEWFLEESLGQAKALDDILDAGGHPVGVLHGIPVALKDTYSLKGHPTTWGYIIHKDNVQVGDSAVVSLLRSAGAVFFCRTTMPQTGMALETVSNLWGRTMNPFNRLLGAGGSSGGDAALVAMKGSPIAPSSDIGGSIRVPAAFNGLYGIRPTAQRIPKDGWESTKSGQIAIRDSAGPVCRSIEDIRLFTQVINAHPNHRYDVSAVPVPWRQVSLPTRLAVGIMKWDRVVMPHPPILRALEHTKRVLGDAGVEVIEFEPPFDCWDVAKITYDIYFQTAAQETIGKVQDAEEPLIPAFANLLEVYNARDLSASDVCQLHLKMRERKTQWADSWNQTQQITSTGRPIDALICPVAPSVGIPHDYNIYWGYTSLFNFLDYPSTVLPVPNFQITPLSDPQLRTYKAVQSNTYDKANHELYNPHLFSNQPTSIQIIGRPFDDEELIEISWLVDKELKVASRKRHIGGNL